METYKYKDIDFLITTDKKKIVPFVKINENRAIKLILDDRKIIRNTKKAISNYLGGEYKVIDGFTIAGLVAKFQVKVLYDYKQIENGTSDKVVIASIKKKQIEIFRSETDTETLEKYCNGLKKYLKKSEAKEQETKTM